MTKWLIKLGLKFVSYDTLVNVIASALANLMEYARLNSTNGGWVTAKEALSEIKNWIGLFEEVYEDDTLTPDEERKIQTAIANCTATKTIYELIQGKKAPKKKKAASASKKATSRKKMGNKK